MEFLCCPTNLLTVKLKIKRTVSVTVTFISLCSIYPVITHTKLAKIYSYFSRYIYMRLFMTPTCMHSTILMIVYRTNLFHSHILIKISSQQPVMNSSIFSFNVTDYFASFQNSLLHYMFCVCYGIHHTIT